MSRSAPWLVRRNPSVLLALVLALSVLTLLLTEPLPLVALYGALAVGACVGARLHPWRFARAQVPFLLFGTGLVVVNALARPGEPLWPDAPVRVTAEGLSIGVVLALRALVIGVGAVAFATSAEPRRLVVSLVQHARLSPRIAYALLAGHRLLGELPRQWRTITRAHAVRLPVSERRRGRASREPRLGVRALARCAFTLLVVSIRSSERTAFALESRGLGPGPRTVWRPVALGWPDGALVAGVALLAWLALLAPRAAGALPA
ncbi:energy-coupling factor transporter transmembrane component T family protein [Litorihabitans aurantiacus]|uniref:Energy-coupling factor transporter transmembrane protein EcfT n=1 Tax=Litorihabitans aurantiacus TaxID=1930061 RepID=A0AA37XEX8_9MICO|nr:energy-coupling factor transporter transmembrane component T [Litorihabitans aurantiacus]GMA32054.1 hypothetical protein GCM10025875_20460 [Litorihabitans aurantiacus]